MRLDGVTGADVKLGEARVTYDPEVTTPERIAAGLEEASRGVYKARVKR